MQSSASISLRLATWQRARTLARLIREAEEAMEAVASLDAAAETRDEEAAAEPRPRPPGRPAEAESFSVSGMAALAGVCCRVGSALVQAGRCIEEDAGSQAVDGI